MRPDQRWFPTNRTARAAWLANFANGFSEVGLSLGFTQGEIESIVADNAVLQFTLRRRAISSLDNQMKAVREFERLITMARNDGSQPNFPAFDPSRTASDGYVPEFSSVSRRSCPPHSRCSKLHAVDRQPVGDNSGQRTARERFGSCAVDQSLGRTQVLTRLSSGARSGHFQEL